MSTTFWTLPGPAAFIERITGALGSGRSALLLCPNERTPDGILDVIETRLDGSRTAQLLSKGWQPQSEAGDAAGIVRSIAENLFDKLALRLPPPGDVNGVSLATATGAESITLLIDARGASTAAQDALVSLAREVAGAMKDVTGWRRFAICAALSPTTRQGLPGPDVALAVEWWWGVIRPLDIELALDGIPVLDPVMTRAAIEVGTWDLPLAREMARGWSGGLASLEHDLSSILGPCDAGPRLINEGHEAYKVPQEQLISAWNAGLVESWGGAVEWHPSIALAEGPSPAIQRVWLAQVKELFPLIEIERTRLAGWLDREAERGGMPRILDVDGLAVEIEDLEIGQLVRYLGCYREVRVPADRMRLIRSLRELRNHLAHRRPVDLKTVLELRRSISADRLLDA